MVVHYKDPNQFFSAVHVFATTASLRRAGYAYVLQLFCEIGKVPRPGSLPVVTDTLYHLITEHCQEVHKRVGTTREFRFDLGYAAAAHEVSVFIRKSPISGGHETQRATEAGPSTPLETLRNPSHQSVRSCPGAKETGFAAPPGLSKDCSVEGFRIHATLFRAGRRTPESGTRSLHD